MQKQYHEKAFNDLKIDSDMDVEFNEYILMVDFLRLWNFRM